MEVVRQRFDEAIPLDRLTEHPENPRQGDDAAVAESVDALGFFGAVLVQESSGFVIAGNTRYRVMRAAGETTIPGFWVDCDDDTARAILLVDNRTSDLAGYDQRGLVDLLTSVRETVGTLLGTGYDDAAYELLLQAANSDAILGGVRQGMTPADRADAYDAADIRSIILPYPREDFDEVVEALSQLRTAWGYSTNAEVVHRLATEAVTTAAAEA